MTYADFTPREGTTVHDRWQLTEKLDPLGEGRVWKAVDMSSGSEVVVKFAPTLRGPMADWEHKAHVENFLREARVLDDLNSGSVVRPVTVHEGPLNGNADWPPYLVREYVSGDTLAELLEGSGSSQPLAADDVFDVAESLLPILDDLHAHGVYYRALLPEHIIRTSDSEYVLIDFGAARSGSFDRWESGSTFRHIDGGATTVLGADRRQDAVPPAFRAPEYLDRNDRAWDARSDVWAAGILLWWLSTGELPFTGAGSVIERDIARGIRPEFDTIAPSSAHWLSGPLSAALSVDPSDRPQTPLALLQMIHDARDDNDAVVSDPTQRNAPKHRWTDEEFIELHHDVVTAGRGNSRAVFQRWAERLGTGIKWVSIQVYYYQNRKRIVALLEAAKQANDATPSAATAAPSAAAVEVAPPTSLLDETTQLRLVDEAPAPSPADVETPVAGSSPDYVGIVTQLVKRRDEIATKRAELESALANLNAEAAEIDRRLGGLAA